MTPTHQTTGPDVVNADLDTVTHAASTPETEQPWADLGLAADEYARIVADLPNHDVSRANALLRDFARLCLDGYFD